MSVHYRISVYTSDKVSAGTDANVFIQIYGKRLDTGKIPLKKNIKKTNPFERGQEDVFIVEADDIGGLIKKIRIGHDGIKFGAGWHLDKVIIKIEEYRKTYLFNSKSWFDKNEGDRAIERDLYPEDIADQEGFDDRKRRTPSNEKIRQEMSRYFIQTVTSDIPNASTGANVYILLIGSKNVITDKIFLKKSLDNPKPFQAGRTDTFAVEMEYFGKIKRIIIGHDGILAKDGWHLKKVIIDAPDRGEKWTFDCKKWLDMRKDDQLIERELDLTKFEEYEIQKPTKSNKMSPRNVYLVNVQTSDIKYAGTDANVFLQIFGDKNDSGKIELKKSLSNRNPFEQGQTDKFEINSSDVGEIRKIKVGHDGLGSFSGWHLKHVIIESPLRKKSWQFACNKWLEKGKGDGKTERELFPDTDNVDLYSNDKLNKKAESSNTYIVDVKTSDKANSGTDSKVYIQLFYKKYHTETFFLKKSLKNKIPFMQGQLDRFELENIEFEKIDKIIIGHDNSGRTKSWHLESVKVKAPSHRTWLFPCGKWFDRNQGDGKTERVLFEESDFNERSNQDIQTPKKFIVDVSTSDIAMAGTDSNVFIQLFSQRNSTQQIPLKKSLTNKNPFENGQTDRFELENIEFDDIDKIKIGHDNKGFGPGWHLKSVKIHSPTSRKTWIFPCGKWFDLKEDDKKIERELYPLKDISNDRSPSNDRDSSYDKKNRENSFERPYAIIPTRFIVDVSTSDITMAGTDAKVFLQLFSNQKSTEKLFLKKSLTNKNPFEQAHTDRFELDNIALDDIDKIRIGHDNTGFGPGWHLHSVKIEAPLLRKSWNFPCNRWFDRDEDDRKIERELLPDNSKSNNKLVIDVKTSDISFAGTDANVFIQLFSKKQQTERLFLKHSLTHKNPFEQANTDRFELDNVNMKDIDKIRIGHDNSGMGPGWHLHSVKIQAPLLRKNWFFPCGLWFDRKEGDRKIERDLLPSEEQSTYNISVVTTDTKDAGTDANVYIQLFGKIRDTEILQLKNSKTNRNKFERGDTDVFEFKLPYLGDLHLLKVGHDGSGLASAWHLSNILVECVETNERWNFYYKDWLSTENGFEHEVDLEPGDYDSKKKSYMIDVFTGDCGNAGTDANVFLTIYGKNGNSGERKLASSKSNLNKFERNQVDRFIVSASDLGELFKIKIRHDNSGTEPGWFLDKIEILERKNLYKFICKRWLADDEDDKKIERIIFEKNYKVKIPEKEEKAPRPLSKTKTYYVSVITGDKSKSEPIDANVYIQLYGDEGISEEKKLRQSKTHDKKFGKYQIDLFPLNFDYLGPLFALKIRHDNIGVFNDWYLDRVEVHVDDYNYKFHCKNWLASNKKDGKIERTLIEENAIMQFEEIGF